MFPISLSGVGTSNTPALSEFKDLAEKAEGFQS